MVLNLGDPNWSWQEILSNSGGRAALVPGCLLALDTAWEVAETSAMALRRWQSRG